MHSYMSIESMDAHYWCHSEQQRREELHHSHQIRWTLLNALQLCQSGACGQKLISNKLSK